MIAVDFDKIKQDFINADVDEKIKIYTTTEGLSVEQFRELLRYYPTFIKVRKGYGITKFLYLKGTTKI